MHRIYSVSVLIAAVIPETAMVLVPAVTKLQPKICMVIAVPPVVIMEIAVALAILAGQLLLLTLAVP